MLTERRQSNERHQTVVTCYYENRSQRTVSPLPSTACHFLLRYPYFSSGRGVPTTWISWAHQRDRLTRLPHHLASS